MLETVEHLLDEGSFFALELQNDVEFLKWTFKLNQAIYFSNHLLCNLLVHQGVFRLLHGTLGCILSLKRLEKCLDFRVVVALCD